MHEGNLIEGWHRRVKVHFHSRLVSERFDEVLCYCHDVKLPILVPIRTDQQIPADSVDQSLISRA